MNWVFRRLTSFEEAQWMKRLDKAEVSHVFFHPVLMKVWLDTYNPIRHNELLIVEATNKDGNVALLPLVIWEKGWKHAFIRSIVAVGYSDYDYHDPIFLREPSKEVLQAYWDGLLEFLKPYKADIIELEGIRTSLTDDGRTWLRGEICPHLQLISIHSEEELMNFFSTKLRGDIRRQIRRLNEIGSLSFKEYASVGEVPTKVFDEFIEFHSQKWPKAYKAPGFHRRLVDQCSKEGPIHFSTLMVGDAVVAWHLGFDFKGTYYYYMPVGHPDFQKFSPVKVHLYYLVCRAIERGYQMYDHLRGDETYKGGWANGSDYVNTLLTESGTFQQGAKKVVLQLKQLAMKVCSYH